MGDQAKILVIRGGAIGDFILTLPVLKALRRSFPQVGLELLGYPHIAQLAKAGGWVEAVRPIEAPSLARFFAQGADLNRDLARYFSEFALILSYLYDPDEVFETNVRRCTDAQFIAGPHRPREEEGLHATQAFLKPLEQLAIFEADARPELELSGSDWHPGPGPWLALHPGSGSERKNWPEANWVALARRLMDESPLKLLLVGGEAEGDRLERLAADLPANRYQMAKSLPLPELGGRLAQCAGFVGHDSGIAHLAAALGLPGVVLWGPSRADIWSPMSDKVRLIHGEDRLDGLPVDTVYEGMGQALAGLPLASKGGGPR